MLKLNVKGKEYILRFGYKVLAKTSLLADVVKMQDIFKVGEDPDNENDSMLENLPKVIEINSNLVLAGMQKYNDEFKVDYDDPASVKEGLEKVYDFMDDYMDEGENTVIDLFTQMVQELTNSGFLSKKSQAMEQAAEKLDATIIPMDHQKAEN